MSQLKELLKSQKYYNEFWNNIRIPSGSYIAPKNTFLTFTGTQMLPEASRKLLENKINSKSTFRKISSVFNLKSDTYTKFIDYDEGNTEWLGDDAYNLTPEDIEIYFRNYKVTTHNLATLIKINEDIVKDKTFNVEDMLTNSIAIKFANAETNAFILGDGNKKPYGILDSNKGCELGIETNKLKYDDLKKLYFSVDKNYRDNACFMMNDETALYLKELKDENGNYLWKENMDTLLGKPVYLIKDMPNIENGNIPIVFGDFSYYWIFDRHVPTIKVLNELYARTSQIGYLAYEFLDAILVDRKAIKSIKIRE